MKWLWEESVKNGFTTGSCSAAAAKAAAYMLLSGRRKETITIDTPKGIVYEPVIEKIERFENEVICAVKKDGGDDIDATHGMYIYAKVSYPDMTNQKNLQRKDRILIEGGKGIGRVTQPGLDQPVGNAAINSVPRKMIQDEVIKVCDLFDYKGSLSVLIFAPEGEEIAKKTFNERLGIIGGISILGTSGIVEPMSVQALLDTIQTEVRQKKAMGETVAAVSPGNYGLEFMKKNYGYDLDKSIKCSNYIGKTIDMVREAGFQKMLLTGHIGKLIKLSGGIMNTHSHEADCRMELLAAAGIRAGVNHKVLSEVLKCLNTEDALRILKGHGVMENVMQYVMEKIEFYLSFRAGDMLQTECMVYSNEFGLLGQTGGVKEILASLVRDKKF